MTRTQILLDAQKGHLKGLPGCLDKEHEISYGLCEVYWFFKIK